MSNYISSAELARRCDVSRAAVNIAIRTQRINPEKVRRVSGRVLVDENHGMQVLGHHRKQRTSPSPAPSPAADLTGLMAWGDAAGSPAGQESSADAGEDASGLEEEIEQWHELVKQLEDQLTEWRQSYGRFRVWLRSQCIVEVMNQREEHPIARDAACDTIAIVMAKLRSDLDEVDIKSDPRIKKKHPPATNGGCGYLSQPDQSHSKEVFIS